MPAVKKPAEKKKEQALPQITVKTYVFPNGDRYEGECIATQEGSVERTGKGKHSTSDGITYEGQWVRDKMNGKGKLTHPSGATYEGEFINNQFHGRGKYTWPNGSYYIGNFVENRLEGEGEFTDTESQQWTGIFRYKAALGLLFKLNME